jgi:hypothetical protein
MNKYLLVCAATSFISITLYSAALAAPVTSADLSGRTICMSNGDRNTFYASGRIASNRFGRGTWAMAPGGVQINAQYKVGLLPLTRRQNGTFLINYTYARLSSPAVVTGRYCR